MKNITIAIISIIAFNNALYAQNKIDSVYHLVKSKSIKK